MASEAPSIEDVTGWEFHKFSALKELVKLFLKSSPLMSKIWWTS